MTEVIVMENAAYQKMMGQIAKIAEFITKNEHKLQDCDFDNDVWLDSQEVADMLHISTRTLQRLRSIPPQMPVQALGDREKGTGKGHHVRTAPDRCLQEKPAVGHNKRCGQ